MYGIQVMRANSCVSPLPTDLLSCFLVLQALLIDGYISQTFQSRAAEQYFLNLLKSSSIPRIRLVLHFEEGAISSSSILSLPIFPLRFPTRQSLAT
jgi:hypothetical protein